MQGGILSPILFTLFTADLEKWCKHSKIYGYADDTTSSCKGKSWKDIIKNLEEDANIILSYMASNGLAANQNNIRKKSHPLPLFTVKSKLKVHCCGIFLSYSNQFWVLF